MNETQIRVCTFPVLCVLAGGLCVYGAMWHDRSVQPEDPNDTTVTVASEFVLNRAVAAGRLFRDPLGTLRIKASRACPT
ncbi:MAG: hypothetical protein JW741_19400 [Sedimentisphaerales bacterium]|nr:hypothetical protein [Sedimentisphaerales bacterium]